MFSLFSIDGKGIAKAIVPIALAALIAFGVYWLYTKSQANQAATAEANANANALNAEGGGTDTADQQLALLESLFGGSGATTANTDNDNAPSDQVQLTAPGQTVTSGGVVGTATEQQAAPTTSGSSTGNEPVTQGA